MTFIDMGDQFHALVESRTQTPDHNRHVGLVVDDRSRVRELAESAGAVMVQGPTLDFLDPWGNRIQVVEYCDVQFMKTDAVLELMGLTLTKRKQAIGELRKKGAKL